MASFSAEARKKWLLKRQICLHGNFTKVLEVRPKNLIASDLNFSSETLPLRRPSRCHSSVSPFVRGMTYLVELCVLIELKMNANH